MTAMMITMTTGTSGQMMTATQTTGVTAAVSLPFPHKPLRQLQHLLLKRPLRLAMHEAAVSCEL